MKKIISMLLVLSMILTVGSFSFVAAATAVDKYEATGNFTWNDAVLSEIMTATQENGEYTFTLDQAKWQEMSEKAFFEYPYYYCYLDAEGNVVDKGTGDANPEGYTKFLCGLGTSFKMPRVNLSLDDMTLFKEASTEPVVISYDYWYDNAFEDAYGRVDNDEYFMSSVFFMDDNTKLENLNITAGCNTQYIKGRTSSVDTSKIAVDGSPAANQWNTVKIVLNSDLTKVIGTVVNGVYTECDHTLGGATKINKMVLMMGRAWTNTDANGEYLPATYKLRNIKFERGLNNIEVTSNVKDGDVDVNPTNIKLSFSENIVDAETIVSAVTIEDCFGEALSSDKYTVVANDDLSGATVKLTSYDFGQMYKVKVNNLRGRLGETMASEFIFSFVTAGKSMAEPVNLAMGKDWEKGANSVDASTAMNAYGTVTNYGDGKAKVEIDNKSYFEYLDGCSPTSGDSNYDLFATNRSPMINLHLGETVDNGKPIAVSFKMKSNMTDVDISVTPQVFLMNDIIVGSQLIAGTSTGRFGGGYSSDHVYRPAAAGETWQDDGEWHEYGFVVNPTLDENGTGRVTRINYDGAIAKDNADIIAHKYSEFSAETPIVAGNLRMQIQLNDIYHNHLTSLDKTIVEIDDVKVYRVDELEAVASDTVLYHGNTTFGLDFSTPVYKDVLEQSIKVYKDDVIQKDVTATVEMFNGNKSASVTLIGLSAPSYVVSLDGLTDIYGMGIAQDSALNEISYHQVSGVCTVTGHALRTEGDDVKLSVMVENMMGASQTLAVIAAAYTEANVLVGVDTTSVTVADGKIATADVLTIADAAGDYDEIRIYLWENLEELKPLGGIYTIE